MKKLLDFFRKRERNCKHPVGELVKRTMTKPEQIPVTIREWCGRCGKILYDISH